ncbi:MAG: DUF6599 family protein [Terriglobales bacterium]
MRLWSRWSSGLICATLAAGIVQAQNSAPSDGASRAPASAGAQKQLLSFLREPLPSHATAPDPVSFYKPESLYQYIDGGADIYLLYDFHILLHEDFESGAAEVTADIYDMGKPEDAFGMYAAERSPRYKFVAIGIEGYRSEGILNFVQSHYYVKLAGSGAGADALLDQFARVLSQRIGGTRTPPALLEQLPREHRVQHSGQYMRKDPLGHAFLAPAYVVAYTWGRQEGNLVISIANDVAGAQARLEQLAKHFKESGECAAAPELGAGGIRAKNSFEGSVIARTQGRYLILAVNPPQNGAEILNETAQSLRRAYGSQ